MLGEAVSTGAARPENADAAASRQHDPRAAAAQPAACDHRASETGSARDSEAEDAATVDGVDVSGLGTFEYARIRTPQALTRRPVPARFKLPLDFFTYQIINLDEHTQVLLTDVRARSRTACRLAHVRVLGRETEVYDDVHFAVIEYGEPLVIIE
mgnify:CR=1 FL=1